MELNNLSLKVLALNTVLDKFREDGENTEDSDTVLCYFQNVWGGGGYDITLVKVSNVILALNDRLSFKKEGPLHTLHNLLVDLEDKTPDAFIDLEG